MSINDLRGQAAKTLALARGIVDGAEKENRAMSDDERANYDQAVEDYTTQKDDIARLEALEAEEKRLEEVVNDVPRPVETATETKEDRKAGKEMAEFRRYLSGEKRGMVSQEDIQGGFLNAPEQFISQLIKDLDDQVFIRGLASTFQIGGSEGIGVPTLDTDYADWDWTGELNSNISEDAAIRIGKREMKPFPMAKLVKISKTLMRRSVMPVDSLVRARLSYKMALTQEKAYLTGSGAQQPLGVFTASDDGISTGQDVSTGNTTTAMTVDGLKNAKYTLKAGYWPGCQWIFHRDGVKMLAKLKDGEGRYLWQDSIVGTEPARLLGFPVNISENAPNTFTTGLYVGILGDFSHYWIIDALSLEMQVLNELYAATNQIGIIGRYEGDGAPTLENAFVRVKLA